MERYNRLVIDSPLLDQRHRPSYPAAEAGRLVGLAAGRVRRWLKGYGYSYGDTVRYQPPVLQRSGTLGTSYASFLELVDLLFVKRFLDHGVSLQRVRRALPFVSFGAPSIVGRGVKTANVHDLFVAENESLAAVRAWWDLTDAEIEAAVAFEVGLAA